MKKYSTIKIIKFIFGVIVFCQPNLLMADWGVSCIRIMCDTKKDNFYIEPFVTWSGGPTPYHQFDAQIAVSKNKLTNENDTFYAFDRRAIVMGIKQICETDTRTINVYIKEGKLELSENNKLIVKGLDVSRNRTTINAFYALRSGEPRKWEECNKKNGDGKIQCKSYDLEKQNSAELLYARTIPNAQIQLNRGADINSHDIEGYTALHEASNAGNCKLVKFLLDNGADSNMVDAYGRTPLSFAISRGHDECKNILLQFGAILPKNDK